MNKKDENKDKKIEKKVDVKKVSSFKKTLAKWRKSGNQQTSQEFK